MLFRILTYPGRNESTSFITRKYVFTTLFFQVVQAKFQFTSFIM